MSSREEKALREVLVEAQRLLAAMNQYAGDFPLDVHHAEVVALDSAVHRAESASESSERSGDQP